jgi:predicted DsbA family dithiol-disulfide isomerase
VLCPWCYLGERRLDTAIASSPHAAHIDVRVHSFQLDPDAPTKAVPTLEYLARPAGRQPP